MPGPEWVAEQPVGVSRAAALVAGQFPSLRGATVEPFAEGWDNTVFVVDGAWAFRFPRRQVAVAGVVREVELLPRLAPLLPLPVPVPELVGVPEGNYPWPFFGARLLAGRELADAGVPDHARTPAATALGGFLRALHAPDVAARLGAGLPVDPMRRASPTARAPMARERLARLEARATWTDDGRVEGLLSRGETVGESAATPVLVHGDLHVRHVLVDGLGAAAGVIDWGTSAWPTRASTSRLPTARSPAAPATRSSRRTATTSLPTRRSGPAFWRCPCPPDSPTTPTPTAGPRCSPSRWPVSVALSPETQRALAHSRSPAHVRVPAKEAS